VREEKNIRERGRPKWRKRRGELGIKNKSEDFSELV